MSTLAATPFAMPTRPTQPTQSTLPALREELRLEPARADHDGAPRWRLCDPLRNRFFLLGDADVKLLSLWGCGTPAALRETLAASGHALDTQQLEGLVAFLREHQLVRADDRTTQQRLLAQTRQAAVRGPAWALRQLLGFRMPLWRPQTFLLRSLPALRSLWSAPVVAAWSAATLLGLYLASRQWEAFLATFGEFLTPGGFAAFALALAGLKLIHELGHAYAAAHHGCRVGSIGVCVAMGVPMLYTETGDTARLDARAPRLWIAAGGVLAETFVAGLATLAWSLLPDGSLRSAAFVIATSSWAMSLAVNLNPFSRFDGYYFLADGLRIDNLQPRALRYAGWWLGRMLWGPIEAAPEAAPAGRAALFVGYGALVWLWRLSLNAGISWMVYTQMFKTAGVLVGVFAAWLLIAQPMARRARGWWQRRAAVTRPRRLGSILFGGALLLGLLWPLDRHVAVPAMLGWQRSAVIQPPENAQVVEVLVHAGQTVKAGEVLLRLSSPELQVKRAQARLAALAADERLDRIGGDSKDRADAAVLVQQRLEARADVQGLADRADLLEVRAAEDGRIVDLRANLQPGQWVRPDMTLARLLYGASLDARGFVAERELPRLRLGAAGRFVAEDPAWPAIDVRLREIEPTAAETISPEALSSMYGGVVAAQANAAGKPVPVVAQHRTVFATTSTSPAADATPPMPMQLRGEIRLDAAPQSIAAQVGRQAWRLVMSELRS